MVQLSPNSPVLIMVEEFLALWPSVLLHLCGVCVPWVICGVILGIRMLMVSILNRVCKDVSVILVCGVSVSSAFSYQLHLILLL